MALSLSTYPLSLDVKDHLDDWLDTLPVITPENTPEAHLRTYDCCAPSHHPSVCNPELRENNILVLPCVCRWRRECIWEVLSPDEEDDDQCMFCGFQIFESLPSPEGFDIFEIRSAEGLENWMKGLESTSLKLLEEQGKETNCGICQQKYHDPEAPPKETDHKPETPCLLPCGHSFGFDCLQRWLSPFPHGGNGNTCPTCRGQLFSPWPFRYDFIDADLTSISDSASNSDETEDMERAFAEDVHMGNSPSYSDFDGDEPEDMDRDFAEDVRAQIFLTLTHQEIQQYRDEEREYFLRYVQIHSRVFELSDFEAAADLQWMSSMTERNDEVYFQWVGERRPQREQRRERIREALSGRDAGREQRRRDRFNDIVSSGLEAGIV